MHARLRQSRQALVAIFLCASAGPALAQEEGAESSPDLLAPGGLVLFYSDTGPLSFVSMTPKDLPPGSILAGDVTAKSCQHALSIPLAANLRSTSVSGAAGNGGQRKALEQIKSEHPDLAGLFDVRIDDHVTIILGIYKRSCVEITARGFRRAS